MPIMTYRNNGEDVNTTTVLSTLSTAEASIKTAAGTTEEHMERSVVRRAPRSREGRTFCRCPQPYRGLRQNVRQPSTA